MFRACVCSECGLTLLVDEDEEGVCTPLRCSGCHKAIDHVHLSLTGDNDVAWVANDDS